jgi:uncharacterized protein
MLTKELIALIEKYLILIATGGFGGWLAERSGLPGGAIVGSMLASGLAAICFSTAIELPPAAGMAIQIILGISLGMSFDRSFLEIAGKAMPLAIISTLVLLMVSIVMALLAHKFGLVDFATALFGFSPGGMSGMSILAQSEGHKAPIVALFHLVRIFTLFLVVPQLGRLFLVLVKKI